MSGPRFRRADLYRVIGGRVTAERLTLLATGFYPGVTSVTATRSAVVVSDARSGADHIERVVGHTLQPLVPERASTPALSADGRLAYVRLHFPTAQATDADAFQLVERPLAHGPATVRYNSPYSYSAPLDLASPAWGPHGELAVLERPAAHAAVLIVTGSTLRRLDPAMPGATSLYWSPTGPLGVSDFDHNELLDPRSGRRTVLPTGWAMLCWSPDGQRLLMGHGRALGLIDPAHPLRISPLGVFMPGAVWGAAWVP